MKYFLVLLFTVLLTWAMRLGDPIAMCLALFGFIFMFGLTDQLENENI